MCVCARERERELLMLLPLSLSLALEKIIMPFPINFLPFISLPLTREWSFTFMFVYYNEFNSIIWVMKSVYSMIRWPRLYH